MMVIMTASDAFLEGFPEGVKRHTYKPDDQLQCSINSAACFPRLTAPALTKSTQSFEPNSPPTLWPLRKSHHPGFFVGNPHRSLLIRLSTPQSASLTLFLPKRTSALIPQTFIPCAHLPPPFPYCREPNPASSAPSYQKEHAQHHQRRWQRLCLPWASTPLSMPLV